MRQHIHVAIYSNLPVLSRVAGDPSKAKHQAPRPFPSPISNVPDRTSGGHPPASITVNGKPLSEYDTGSDS